MVLDVIGILLLILFFVRGFQKGLIIAVFSLIGTVVGVICALKFSHTLAQYLDKHHIVTNGWGQVVAYIGIFILVASVIWMIAKLIEAALKALLLGFFNKLAGAVLYTFMAAFIWSSILWLCSNLHLITADVISHSYTYKYLSPVAPWLFTHLGYLFPFVKSTMHDLQHFFDHMNKTI